MYLRLMGRGVFVQRWRKADAELNLANRYKMDEQEEVQTRWDKASLYKRLMMDSLCVCCGGCWYLATAIMSLSIILRWLALG